MHAYDVTNIRPYNPWTPSVTSFSYFVRSSKKNKRKKGKRSHYGVRKFGLIILTPVNLTARREGEEGKQTGRQAWCISKLKSPYRIKLHSDFYIILAQCVSVVFS